MCVCMCVLFVLIVVGSLNTMYHKREKKIDRQKSKSFVTDWLSPEKKKRNWLEFAMYFGWMRNTRERMGKLGRKSMCQPFYGVSDDKKQKKRKRKSERNYSRFCFSSFVNKWMILLSISFADLNIDLLNMFCLFFSCHGFLWE